MPIRSGTSPDAIACASLGTISAMRNVGDLDRPLGVLLVPRSRPADRRTFVAAAALPHHQRFGRRRRQSRERGGRQQTGYSRAKNPAVYSSSLWHSVPPSRRRLTRPFLLSEKLFRQIMYRISRREANLNIEVRFGAGRTLGGDWGQRLSKVFEIPGSSLSLRLRHPERH